MQRNQSELAPLFLLRSATSCSMASPLRKLRPKPVIPTGTSCHPDRNKLSSRPEQTVIPTGTSRRLFPNFAPAKLSACVAEGPLLASFDSSSGGRYPTAAIYNATKGSAERQEQCMGFRAFVIVRLLVGATVAQDHRQQTDLGEPEDRPDVT
jgi:hypothetical protein